MDRSSLRENAAILKDTVLKFLQAGELDLAAGIYEKVAGLNAEILSAEVDPEGEIALIGEILRIALGERDAGVRGILELTSDKRELLPKYRRWSSLLTRISRGEATEKEEEEFAGIGLSRVAVMGLLFMKQDLPARPVILSNPVPEGKSCLYSKIYVLCPNANKTGGTELLHQMVYHLNRLGADAYIVYLKINGDLYAHPELVHYVRGRILTSEQVEDFAENAVVVPEGWPECAGEFRRVRKIFWWLSVDNFKEVYHREESSIRGAFQWIRTDFALHLYQSEYARRYALENGISEEKLHPLGDYLNTTFPRETEADGMEDRKNRVLYNPKKGMAYTAMLREKAPDLDWVAIENMTTEEVGALLRTSKVYIDFGEHPGRDRIPREAAICGCVVITGRKGAAGYAEDMPIPEEYRIDENVISVEEVIRRIRYALEHFEDVTGEYEGYRRRILGEKEQFVRDLKAVFFKTEEV